MGMHTRCTPRRQEFRRTNGWGWLRLLVLLPIGRLEARAAEPGWLARFHGPLREVIARQTIAEEKLRALGTPVVGQTAAQIGYLYPRQSAPPPAPPWVQVDLQSRQTIDWIALVPAQVDWQLLDHPAHGFPRRFRIDLSNEPDFATFVTVAAHTDTDFPDPRIAPVSFRVNAPPSRYVRLTVTKLAVEDAVHFFALAELMVISGECNVAIGRPVLASAFWRRAPRWDPANLVDGRTPLGPPIQRDLPLYDGLYAGPLASSEPLWMQLDLGQICALQEVRLHPIHRRLGSDIPGFSFPARFRVELADDVGFTRPIVLLDATGENFPNPGNNPVTIRADNTAARYVRIVMIEPDVTEQIRRFGLSELEVYSGNVNVARSAIITSSPATVAGSKDRPRSQLIDGYTSYGRLISLPEWLELWQQRADLSTEIARLGVERLVRESAAQQQAKWLGGALCIAALAGVALLLRQQQRRRARELDRFRARLARDLHDEIGSNLAGISVISETAGETAAQASLPHEDWLEVNRIARQTTDAMREVVWLIGARPEAGIDLIKHLQLVSTRMLPRREVRWEAGAEPLPAAWSVEARREVFLFFKESLANIVRHSRATAVDITARFDGECFDLRIVDNGRGFRVEHATHGVGLSSLRERARTLGAACEISSEPGAGTRIVLRVPIVPIAPV